MWPPVATTTTFLPDYSRSGTRYSTLRALKKSLFLCGEKPIFSFSAIVVRHASDWLSKRCPASLIVSFGIDTFSLLLNHTCDKYTHHHIHKSLGGTFSTSMRSLGPPKSHGRMRDASTWEDERKTDGATIQTYMYPLSLRERRARTVEHEHGHM